MDEQQKPWVNTQVTLETIQALDEIATQKQVSRSAVVRWAIDDYLARVTEITPSGVIRLNEVRGKS